MGVFCDRSREDGPRLIGWPHGQSCVLRVGTIEAGRHLGQQIVTPPFIPNAEVCENATRTEAEETQTPIHWAICLTFMGDNFPSDEDVEISAPEM
jgi:hypothetical protein